MSIDILVSKLPAHEALLEVLRDALGVYKTHFDAFASLLEDKDSLASETKVDDLLTSMSMDMFGINVLCMVFEKTELTPDKLEIVHHKLIELVESHDDVLKHQASSYALKSLTNTIKALKKD
jgi:hypothetical protein